MKEELLYSFATLGVREEDSYSLVILGVLKTIFMTVLSNHKMSHPQGKNNESLHHYIFPKNKELILLPELRNMILEYWLPRQFLSYLNTWSLQPHFDIRGNPYWYDKRGVSIAYIEPQYIDEDSKLCYELANDNFDQCLSGWVHNSTPSVGKAGLFSASNDYSLINRRSDLFLNITIMISIANKERSQDRENIGLTFIPIECLDSYCVCTDGSNSEYIVLNVTKLMTKHIDTAITIDTNNTEAMKQYILQATKLSQLFKANPR